jgi:hypothetical protein
MPDMLAILPKADPVRIAWPNHMEWEADGATPESKAAEDATKAYRSELREQVLKVWRELKDAANGCPACILAAMRQSGVAPVVDWWKFKDELKSWMDDTNQAKMDREVGYGNY